MSEQEAQEQHSYLNNDRRQGWHVDKTVSITHVLTTATILVSGMFYLADQDKRISANSINIEHNAEASKRQEDRTTKALDDINKNLDRIADYILKQK